MRILTCTGYYSTGSSAITDLLSEYDCCFCKPGDYELRFIYDPDGLSDLEYHLVENHNRHNSGHAIKRYLKLVDYYKGNYFSKKNEQYFDGHWLEFSKEYINSLVEIQYKGTWLYDYLDRGLLFHYFNSLLRKIVKRDMLTNEFTYCAYPSKSEFEQKTKKYLNDLFSVINTEQAPFVVADQVLPPSDIKRYLAFFDDIKVIIVDRDPRDIFFLEKYIRKGNVIPSDAKTFCDWFKYTRRHRFFEEVNTKNSMLINFEDLIYKYDESTQLIENFCGLSSENHSLKKTRFIPEKSINNTQIWRKISHSATQQEEVKCIEKSLGDYLYDFPVKTEKKVIQEIF